MKMGLLLRYSWRRVRWLLIASTLLLTGFQILMVVVARSIQRTNSFAQMAALMPPFVRELMPGIAGVLSFSGMVCMGYFEIAVIGALTALAIGLGTMITSEVEIGFSDLVLARPVARHTVVTRSILLLVISVVLVVGLMVAGTFAGLAWFAPDGVRWPPTAVVRSLALNLGVLTLAWGAVALAIGSAMRRRGAAGAIAGLLALTMFLLDYVGRAWKAAEPYAKISPYRYYASFDLLMGKPIPSLHLEVLAGITVCSFGLAYWLFARRDITR